MNEPHYQRSPRGRPNIASCIVATSFLIFLIVSAVAVFFVLFKPKDPQIAVEAVQFPAFSVANGTFNLTFFQFVSVTNPNRDAFSHFDSSLQLVYSGTQVGVVFIPAGEIGGGRTQHMSAKFDVEEFPLATATAERGVSTAEVVSGDGGVGPTMEIETRMKLVGRVRVLKVLAHRVESRARCGVSIRVSDGSVLGFHC
ncbi:uncharacterized protein LOC130780730 [Actinidia eriantha]|uniref:uncharacterized protein LOC130780730 n=1 Tax=Actinidia eriantha TaxID=165200 RepID=UPI0025853F38|nr:uncharacterized protein LOC130780730 [Actinidia eriantha]